MATWVTTQRKPVHKKEVQQEQGRITTKRLVRRKEDITEVGGARLQKTEKRNTIGFRPTSVIWGRGRGRGTVLQKEKGRGKGTRGVNVFYAKGE